MSAIKYKVLNDRVFPHGCYRTLAEYKGSAFLGISVICEEIVSKFSTKCCLERFDSFGKVCGLCGYSFRKV